MKTGLAVGGGAAALTAVFVARFVPARMLLFETGRPAIAAVIVLLAAFAFGRLALRLVRCVIPSVSEGPGRGPARGSSPPAQLPRSASNDIEDVIALSAREESNARRRLGRVTQPAGRADALLIGFATFGIVAGATALISTTIAPILAILGAFAGAFLIGRERFDLPRIHPLLAIAIGIAFIEAITPVSSPDELVYKLAIPHAWQLYGRMIELPLNSNSYLAMALQCADVAALALGGGIAAKLAHFGLYLAVLAVVRRIGGEWAAIALAFTPALMIIAGWAWSEWAVLGLLLVSYDRWSRDDIGAGACALGCAISCKYTALPWGVAFALLMLIRGAKARREGATVSADAPSRRRALAPLVILAFGAFFYVRNLIWTGSPIAPLLLPNAPQVASFRGSAWLGLIQGDDIFDPRIIDESLGILLPLAFIAGLFAWRKHRDLVLIGLIQMPILLTIGPGSRNIINGVAPVTIAGMALLEEFVPIGLVAAIPLFAQLTLVAYTLESYDFLPYLAGKETAQQTIARTRAFAKPYDWIARNTPPDARVLLLAENRTFYLQRRFVAGGNLDSPRIADWLARGGLSREHFTHIVIHKPWYRVGNAPLGTLEKEYMLQVPPDTHRKVMQFLATRARLQYQDSEYVIYGVL
jgi:hypothetical protein